MPADGTRQCAGAMGKTFICRYQARNWRVKLMSGRAVHANNKDGCPILLGVYAYGWYILHRYFIYIPIYVYLAIHIQYSTNIGKLLLWTMKPIGFNCNDNRLVWLVFLRLQNALTTTVETHQRHLSLMRHVSDQVMINVFTEKKWIWNKKAPAQ